MGEVPPQELLGDDRQKEKFEDDRLDEWEAKLLDDENQPELYNTLEVLRLKDNINRVALAAYFLYIIGTFEHLFYKNAFSRCCVITF